MDTRSFIDVIVFVAGGLLFPIISFGIARLLAPHNPTPEKLTTYECGVPVIGDSRVRFPVHYYVFALLFVVFDVETAFLYPWAVVFKQLGLFALVEALIFIAILVVGLVYAWKKKVLRWV